MVETLLNYGLFFIGLLLFVLLLAAAKKFPILGYFLSALKWIFIIGFLLLYGVLIIFSVSFLAALYISLISLFVTEPHFFAEGKRLDVLLGDPIDMLALVPFSIMYGILYFVSYMGAGLFLAPFKLNVWVYNGLTYFITISATIFGYPLLIHTFFPTLQVTYLGVTFLLACIFTIMIKQFIRKEYRAYQRSRPIYYIIYRLIPWIKKGSPPDNEPYLDN